MIVYKEPKDKEAYKRWRTDSGYAYDIWYQTGDVIYLRRNYMTQGLAPEFVRVLDECEKMVKNRKDFPDYYPVKYAKIEFIYGDRLYVLTPDTLGIMYEFDFEVSKTQIQEKLKGIGVLYSQYSGMLD